MSMNKPTANMLAAFRLLRDAGGWWTAEEVAEQLVDRLPPERAGATAARWLSALARRGHVSRRAADRCCRYGVTAACLAPEGESLRPSTTAPKLVERGAGAAA